MVYARDNYGHGVCKEKHSHHCGAPSCRLLNIGTFVGVKGDLTWEWAPADHPQYKHVSQAKCQGNAILALGELLAIAYRSTETRMCACMLEVEVVGNVWQHISCHPKQSLSVTTHNGMGEHTKTIPLSDMLPLSYAQPWNPMKIHEMIIYIPLYPIHTPIWWFPEIGVPPVLIHF